MATKRYLAVCVLILCVACAGGLAVVSAQPAVNDDAELVCTVRVTGTGEVRVIPDRATVRLGVQAEAEMAADALAENNRRMLALIGALQEAGVAPEDIQTQVVRLQPRREEPIEPREGLGQIVEYLATNVVEVTVRNLLNLGAIIDAAVQAGGDTVQGINFQVSQPAEAIVQARQRAMQDATMAAEQLAMLAGADLAEVLTISEARSAPIAFERVEVAETAAVPIQPGTESVQVMVNVTWRLQ